MTDRWTDKTELLIEIVIQTGTNSTYLLNIFNIGTKKTIDRILQKNSTFNSAQILQYLKELKEDTAIGILSRNLLNNGSTVTLSFPIFFSVFSTFRKLIVMPHPFT